MRDTMDFDEAIRTRHSVRQYTEQKIEGEVLEKLQAEIDRINSETGMRIELVLDEPTAFNRFMLKGFMKFKNAVNYLDIIGPESDDLNVMAGYCGEHLVLFAQTLGLRTCWAMMAKNTDTVRDDGCRAVIKISIGYGENDGKQHKNKAVSEVADLTDAPDWFVKGVDYAMMAPTGVNRQGFKFERDGNKVRLIAASTTLAQIDAGIVKYHFECGAGLENFSWMD